MVELKEAPAPEDGQAAGEPWREIMAELKEAPAPEDP
jgi:hypothetical protein